MMQLGLFLRIPTENCQFFKYKKENIWDYCDGTVIYFWEFCSENCYPVHIGIWNKKICDFIQLWRLKAIKIFALFFHELFCILNSDRKRIGQWHFVTVSGHCFAHYINSLYKTGDLIVILRCPTYLNLNYIKNYDIKDILFCLQFFSIL